VIAVNDPLEPTLFATVVTWEFTPAIVNGPSIIEPPPSVFAASANAKSPGRDRNKKRPKAAPLSRTVQHRSKQGHGRAMLSRERTR
jgi:hypothetical protein